MVRRKWLWKVLVPFVALAFIAAGCGDDDDEGAGGSSTTGGETTTYKIAFVGAETGDNANLGINIRNGARVAIEEANEEGGNIRFELDTFDTQGDPAQASTVKDDFINDDEILGIVGPAFSGETKAILQDLTDANLVMISASATAVDIPDTVAGTPVFHRIVPDDAVQGSALGDYIVDGLGGTSAAYIHDNSDYGKGLAEGTKAILEGKNVTTLAEEVIDPKSQDYSSAVNDVKAANPDVIFYGGYYAEAGRLKKQLNDAGVTSAVFMSGDGSLDVGFIEAAGDGGNDAQITCACNLATADSGGKLAEFAEKYAEVNDGAQPGTYSTEGYDAAKILIDGIKDGNTTREDLLEYVENVKDFEGLSKTINFAENGNVESGGVFVFEVKEGKLELLGTTDDLVS